MKILSVAGLVFFTSSVVHANLDELSAFYEKSRQRAVDPTHGGDQESQTSLSSKEKQWRDRAISQHQKSLEEKKKQFGETISKKRGGDSSSKTAISDSSTNPVSTGTKPLIKRESNKTEGSLQGPGGASEVQFSKPSP